MIAGIAMIALALATFTYCGIKTIHDFRARRWAAGAAGAAVAILAPAVLGLMGFGLARFMLNGLP
jgi:1,6-anhydro-N-acetylmuramate kinase